MKVRSFYTKIWSDRFFLDLTSAEKLLFIYYVFNPRVNILYCYECPDHITKFETGLSQDILNGGKEKFLKAEKLLFYEDYILIVNGERYQIFSGSKNKVAKLKLFDEMSKKAKDWYRGILDRGIHRGIDTQSIGSETETKIETEIKYETKTKKNEYVDPKDLPEDGWLAMQRKNKL